jgi:hypothetical protein
MGGPFLNTVLLFLFSSSNYSHLALDRLSTHPLEICFGFLRWDANNINTINEMIGTIAHTDIAQAADRALELEGRRTTASIWREYTLLRIHHTQRHFISKCQPI